MKWRPILLYAVLDLAACYFLSSFAYSPDRWGVLGIMIAVTWLLPLALGLWHLVRFWSFYFIMGKERTVRLYVSQMIKFGFPTSGPFFFADEYLTAIMNDEQATMDARLRAAAMAGELGALKDQHPFTLGAAANAALEHAMNEYKKMNPLPTTAQRGATEYITIA